MVGMIQGGGGEAFFLRSTQTEPSAWGGDTEPSGMGPHLHPVLQMQSVRVICECGHLVSLQCVFLCEHATCVALSGAMFGVQLCKLEIVL